MLPCWTRRGRTSLALITLPALVPFSASISVPPPISDPTLISGLTLISSLARRALLSGWPCGSSGPRHRRRRRSHVAPSYEQH
jgi:hypothetical protein